MHTLDMLEQQFGIADDGIHRGANVVAHIEKEASLGHIGALGSLVFAMAKEEQHSEDQQDNDQNKHQSH